MTTANEYPLHDLLRRLETHYPPTRTVLLQAAALIREQAEDVAGLRLAVAVRQSSLDDVREIYAGVEGFAPATAPEAYCLRIIRKMGQAAMGVSDDRHRT